MDRGFDTGPIMSQRHYPIPAGIDGRELERELAVLGGQLLVEATSSVVLGTFTQLPQDEESATFAPIPSDGDLVFDADQPADRLYNLIRGIAPLWGPVNVRIPAAQAEVTVKAAVDVDPYGTLPVAFVRKKNSLLLRCNPGVITLLEAENERLRALTEIDLV